MKKQLQIENKGKKRCDLGKMISKLKGLTTDSYARQHGVKTDKAFTRERSFSLEEFIRYMLIFRKTTLAISLKRFSEKNKNKKLLITSQAFSQARLNIKSTFFYRIMLLLSQYFYTHQYKTFNGYRLLAVDGSKIALPNTRKLRKHYGTMGAGSGATTGQASFAFDILNHVIVDAGLHRLKDDERTQALGHLETISLQQQGKSLVIYDRGYASMKLFQAHVDKDIACLFRLKTKFNTQIDALPLGEHFITIGETSVIQLRILKFNLGNGTIETLATTLLDLTISSSLFKALYFMRWGVETFIDVLKNKLELHNFSGRTIEALEQDFYITQIHSLLLYVWVDDVDTKIEQKKEALYQKKLNLNHAVGVLSDNILGLLKGKKIASIILAMTEATIRITIPVMPNRQTQRVSYSRATKYHQNAKSTV